MYPLKKQLSTVYCLLEKIYILYKRQGTNEIRHYKTLNSQDAYPRKRDRMYQNPALTYLKKHAQTHFSNDFSILGAHFIVAHFCTPTSFGSNIMAKWPTRWPIWAATRANCPLLLRPSVATSVTTTTKNPPNSSTPLRYA